MTGTLSNPEIGEKNTTGDPKIVELVKQYNGLLNSENKFPDTALVSPNNSAYREILRSAGGLKIDALAGTYIIAPTSGTSAINGMVASGGTIMSSENGVVSPVPYTYFDDADYTVAGKTQKLRVRAQVGVNGTKPTIKFTIGLYPVTIGGAADFVGITLGTVVSGSTVEINEPAASGFAQGNSGDFTVPADGAYAFGVVTSGTLTNNSAVLISAQLQTRSV